MLRFWAGRLRRLLLGGATSARISLHAIARVKSHVRYCGSLWARAKELGGKEGLSGFSGEALADYVDRKESERLGFARHSIRVAGVGLDKRVRFDGRVLAETLIGQGPDEPDAVLRGYQTKGGRLVLVVSDEADSQKAIDYSVHDTLESLTEDQVLLAVPEREEFLDALAEALGENEYVWID